ncbi:MAG TPA: dienelactone hydrolase family protein [Falsiroseomonas sp.]|jgi:dienelactone hydrolase|nr:dienelactone hydrolase family protein [Falsiroseomonas sp.]
MTKVEFPTRNPWTLSQVAADPHGPPMTGGGTLFLPTGIGQGERRSAVVVLEGLGGVIPERELRYARMLAEQGHVALAVDTFGPRHAQKLSHPLRALRVTEAAMLADAYAALDWLARLPFVDPDRIAVIGFSYGAMVSTFAAYRQIADLYAPDGLRFAAHASFYGCTVARFADPTATGAPVRIFIGGLDENVCVERSHAIAEDLRRGGADARIHLYPDAYHQWDSKDLKPRFTRWSLKRYAFVVEPDNRVWDTRTRLTMRGPASRTAMLIANMDPRGYHMLRDERIVAQSDAELLAFLAQSIGCAPRRPGCVAPGEPGSLQTAG